MDKWDNHCVEGSFYGREIIDVDCLMHAIVGVVGCEKLNKILREHDDLLEFLEDKRIDQPEKEK